MSGFAVRESHGKNVFTHSNFHSNWHLRTEFELSALTSTQHVQRDDPATKNVTKRVDIANNDVQLSASQLAFIYTPGFASRSAQREMTITSIHDALQYAIETTVFFRRYNVGQTTVNQISPQKFQRRLSKVYKHPPANTVISSFFLFMFTCFVLLSPIPCVSFLLLP